MNAQKRIQELMDKRRWTIYRLSKQSGLSHGTISNLFKRNTAPTLPTLEAICTAFDISLREFFSTEDDPALTEEQAKLFAKWSTLNEEQKQVLLALMDLF